MNLPPPRYAPPLTMHIYFCVDDIPRGRLTLMDSKMVRFAFQFSNLPLNADKAPRPPRNNASAKSH